MLLPLKLTVVLVLGALVCTEIGAAAVPIPVAAFSEMEVPLMFWSSKVEVIDPAEEVMLVLPDGLRICPESTTLPTEVMFMLLLNEPVKLMLMLRWALMS